MCSGRGCHLLMPSCVIFHALAQASLRVSMCVRSCVRQLVVSGSQISGCGRECRSVLARGTRFLCQELLVGVCKLRGPDKISTSAFTSARASWTWIPTHIGSLHFFSSVNHPFRASRHHQPAQIECDCNDNETRSTAGSRWRCAG